MRRRDHTSRGLYLARMIKVCMDASGDQSDEQQSREKSIAFEEQKTIESQEGAVDEGSTEDVNESPAITTSPI